jgi:hypothetical protein
MSLQKYIYVWVTCVVLLEAFSPTPNVAPHKSLVNLQDADSMDIAGILSEAEDALKAAGDSLEPSKGRANAGDNSQLKTISSKQETGKFIRNIMGKTTQAARTAIEGAITGSVDAVVTAAQNQVEQTASEIRAIPGKVTEEIKAIPRKMVDAAAKKASETAEEISMIPNRVVDAAAKKASETAKDISKIPNRVVEAVEAKAVEIAEEIKATPKNLKDVLAKTMDDVKTSLIGNKEKVRKPERPSPPTTPPRL